MNKYGSTIQGNTHAHEMSHPRGHRHIEATIFSMPVGPSAQESLSDAIKTEFSDRRHRIVIVSHEK